MDTKGAKSLTSVAVIGQTIAKSTLYMYEVTFIVSRSTDYYAIICVTTVSLNNHDLFANGYRLFSTFFSSST